MPSKVGGDDIKTSDAIKSEDLETAKNKPATASPKKVETKLFPKPQQQSSSKKVVWDKAILETLVAFSVL